MDRGATRDLTLGQVYRTEIGDKGIRVLGYQGIRISGYQRDIFSRE